ncbi:30S ribosome-binding factor RbfA [Candidatus Palauibacter sp.]|uniref:30S ribosome-binding factor RbfA n=1 Tax=Candidatus Palauibacter sp. TaxID=3101350 RepID=UPI003AF2067E
MTHRHRGERLGELFRREFTRLLMGPLKDPRLEGVTVTEVRATRDLSFATVYVRSEDDVEEGIEALERAVGFIRRELGRSLRLRKIPEFRFLPDETPEHASRIEALLRQVHESDGQREG